MIVSELEHDLRATGEDIAADSARLTAIEEAKARLDARDPHLAQLSAEGEAIASRLVPKTAAERELVDQLAEEAGSTD
jgi:hypothetical protein